MVPDDIPYTASFHPPQLGPLSRSMIFFFKYPALQVSKLDSFGSCYILNEFGEGEGGVTRS